MAKSKREKLPVNEYIKEECLKFKGEDPIALAVKIMNSDYINMHGPEHHFIVPAVLLTCVYNHKKSENNLKAGLDLAEIRAEKETPRKCEFSKGTCGAAIGSGMFLNMLTDRTADMEDEWALDKELSGRAIKAILDHPGPRCCKRDTYLTIHESVKFLKEKFEIDLPDSEAKCTFSLRNESCGHEECVFYNLKFSLV